MLSRRVHQSIPMPAMLEVVKYNTDFELAVAFYKMGYPLKLCMQGVPWPQVRTRQSIASEQIADLEEWNRSTMAIGMGNKMQYHWPEDGFWLPHLWFGSPGIENCRECLMRRKR